MTKPLTADQAAQEVTAALQPGVTFNGMTGVKQPVPPKATPLPEPLRNALGIDQPWPSSLHKGNS